MDATLRIVHGAPEDKPDTHLHVDCFILEDFSEVMRLKSTKWWHGDDHILAVILPSSVGDCEPQTLRNLLDPINTDQHITVVENSRTTTKHYSLIYSLRFHKVRTHHTQLKNSNKHIKSADSG